MNPRPIVVWALEPATAHHQLGVIAALDEVGVDAAVLPEATPTSLDPIMLAGAVSRRAPRIGLVATLSPWMQPPFLTARALGTLDALTAGRAGWLVVPGPATFAATDDTPRWNPSGVTDEVELEAALADYLAATLALSDSWEPDALVADAGRGQYVDPSKVHVTHHSGSYFRVRGPLNMPRPPQGRPVLFARYALSGGSPAAASAVADVAIVADEAEVESARGLSATVLLEVVGAAAATPPPTTADGYVISGIDEPELHGHLLHVVLPTLVSERGPRSLLRDRLRLPSGNFAWSASSRLPDGVTA
jgi:alkanesulfonate monooxygenase SsuD/methylene tetrahydromethanopterin reductase-like flavin-dependent oxidoreductase (luciferase family)